MWRFYLLSCAAAFRVRSLQVFSMLFSKEETALYDQFRANRNVSSALDTPKAFASRQAATTG